VEKLTNFIYLLHYNHLIKQGGNILSNKEEIKDRAKLPLMGSVLNNTEREVIAWILTRVLIEKQKSIKDIISASEANKAREELVAENSIYRRLLESPENLWIELLPMAEEGMVEIHREEDSQKDEWLKIKANTPLAEVISLALTES
jgi:hypothetical protein